jgi:hypothetical protein
MPVKRGLLNPWVAAFVIEGLVLLGIAIAFAPSGLFDAQRVSQAKEYPLCPDARDVRIAKTTTIRVRPELRVGLGEAHARHEVRPSLFGRE